MRNIKYSQILRLNNELAGSLESEDYNVAVLSNISIHQIKEICEFSLRTEGLNATVKAGDYDNIVQDSIRCNYCNLVIVFWELCNVIDGMQYKIELYNDSQFDSIIEKVKSEIDLVIKNFQGVSLVLFNKFTSLQFSNSNIRKSKFEELKEQLNLYLEDKLPVNVKLVEIEKVIADVGVKKSIDLRNFYFSKALYTVEFFKAYIDYIRPFIMSANGKAKKALIFDCDNTLWKGILGEDGFDGIEMSAKTRDGMVFSEVQGIALHLNKQGILIGLCSKNNPGDVAEVIKTHPDMQLREEHIAINKSNWSEKVTNLREIAWNLNIGLDSLVYIDDSSFEVNFIKEYLPDVTVLQVPERLYEYPEMLRNNIELFYNLSLSVEDKERAKMYRQQSMREETKRTFADIEDYLASLDLKITIYKDDVSVIPRMSQMSQKTNQFNLTTKRYTDSDINKFIACEDSTVFSFSVADKFGDNGMVGMCIINIDNKTRTVDIETFLMSCRIIGRNIEYAFMDYLMNFLSNNSRINNVTAKYIKTPKNQLVKEFYDKCSLILTESKGFVSNYTLCLKEYNPKNLDYIKVVNGK